MREIFAVVLVQRQRPARQLVDPAAQDGPRHFLQVVAVADEILGQAIEQFGVGRRVGDAEVVHRLHEAMAHQVAPDPVDRDPGEVGVVGPGQPVGEDLTPVLALGQRDQADARQHGPGRLVGQRLRDLALVRQRDQHLAGRGPGFCSTRAKKAPMP